MSPAELNEQLNLPRPPGAFRRVMRAHPRWVDGILAGLYILGTVAAAVLGGFIPQDALRIGNWTTPEYLTFPQLALLILITASAVIGLFTRRRYPLASLIVVAGISATAPETMTPAMHAVLAVFVLLYSVPVYGSVRSGWIGYGITVVLSMIPGVILSGVVTADSSGPVVTLTATVVFALIMLVPLMMGINSGDRQRYTAAIIDRAHQLARERDQLARLAVAEERTRIAREMHDIVAHSVSVMVTLSEGAAHVVDSDPADARLAMTQSAETGRTALTEMRRLIGVLREDEGALEAAELAPAAGIDSLPELMEGFRAAGLTVTLTLKGTPTTEPERAEQGRELAIYRTVQEALTNTLRYAGQEARASVVVHQGPATSVTIEDDGGVPGHARTMDGIGSGHGLIGLAERLRVFGGELEYGPTRAGGWTVTAVLPASRDGEGEATHD